MDHPFVIDAVIGAATAVVATLVFMCAARFVQRRTGAAGPAPAELALDEMLVDPTTGLASNRAWNEVVRHEEDRLARYGRPVTVLVAELDGLDALSAGLGQGVADRLIPPVAAAIQRHARAADVVARTGHARFVGLLPETDEVAATNYVERVRAECDSWLEADALAVRLAVGWAQPVAGEHIADALRVAEDRMNADRRRIDFRAAPSAASSDVQVERPISVSSRSPRAA